VIVLRFDDLVCLVPDKLTDATPREIRVALELRQPHK